MVSIRSSLSVVEALLPPSCPVCGARGAAPCAACWRELRPAPVGPVPAGLDRCRSLLSYEGAGRELIARLKYRNARSVVAWLALGMAGLVRRWVSEVGGGAAVVVTWAPTTPARRRSRGYDQAELLARAVAVELGVRCTPLLRRLPGPPQTGRSRDERRHGPAFATRAPPRRLPGLEHRGVLLVDDLLTTGATLSAAASTLRSAGPGITTVVGLTAGRTPRTGGPP